MRNSKPTPHTNNVVPFRRKADLQLPAAPAVVSKTPNSAPKSPKSKSGHKAQRPHDLAWTKLQMLAMSSKGIPRTAELVDELAPRTVRQILRRAGSGDPGKPRLPKQIWANLNLMCKFKHPVGLILRDWLDGNRRFLPANLQTLVEHSTCVREDKP